MKYAGHLVRKAVLAKLVGAINIGLGVVPVYGTVPNAATYPHVFVKTKIVEENEINKTSFISSVEAEINIITRSSSDSLGQLQSELITNAVSQLLRVSTGSYMNMSSDGFSVISQSFNPIQNLEERYPDNTYYRSIFSFVVKVQEL